MSEADVSIPAPEAGLWTTVRESLAGSPHGSYTAGSIDRALVLLGIPMVRELVLAAVFAALISALLPVGVASNAVIAPFVICGSVLQIPPLPVGQVVRTCQTRLPA